MDDKTKYALAVAALRSFVETVANPAAPHPPNEFFLREARAALDVLAELVLP